ncbi:MAG: hypothetical protein IJ864_03500 [Alphaproteobacteria bacterium]|nr:hypothetical protein [Alphaproteobacteria bacterium]
MVKFFREYWFGLLLSTIVVIFALFTVIITVAPDSDARMRGFTPCTYQMAARLSQGTKLKVGEAFKVVWESYGCYLRVMHEGWKGYLHNQQPTPWANYLFEPETWSDDEDNAESALGSDLENASLLKDGADEKSTLYDDVKQENDNGSE